MASAAHPLWSSVRVPLMTALACLALVAAAPAPASAAEDLEQKVTRMNKRAMEDYDALEFDSARRTLIDAVSLLRANGLDESPLAARTYLNLGVVYINGFRDRNRGIHEFVNALRIKPDLKLDRAIATPELDEALRAAGRQVGQGGRGGGAAAGSGNISNGNISNGNISNGNISNENNPTGATGTPANGASGTPANEAGAAGGSEPGSGSGLEHQAVDESRPLTPIPVRARIAADYGAARVFVFYRETGREDFISLPLKATGGGNWVGVIPGEAVNGATLQYYLEARDARGRPLVAAGSAASPFIVTITAGARVPSDIPEVDVEDPLAKERAARRRAEEEKRARRHHLFVFVMPGFGLGFEPGGNHTEVAWQYAQDRDLYVRQPVGAGGVAFAPFHLAVELGWLVTRHFSLSLLGRIQVVTGANAESRPPADAPTNKSWGAAAGFLRGRYLFFDGRFHPYVHLDIGGGEIRHLLDVTAADSDLRPLVDASTAGAYNGGNHMVNLQRVCPGMGGHCADTIALGYLFAGGGAGIWYDFASHFAFIVDLNILGAVGLGDHQSGLNIDLQIGIGAHFL